MAADFGGASVRQRDQRFVSNEATPTVQPAARRRHLVLVPPPPAQPQPFDALLRRSAMDSSPGLEDVPPPPPSGPRRIAPLAPLRPITVPEGRGRVSSTRLVVPQSSWMPRSEPVRDWLLPMAVALLCGAVFWLLASFKAIPW